MDQIWAILLVVSCSHYHHPVDGNLSTQRTSWCFLAPGMKGDSHNSFCSYNLPRPMPSSPLQIWMAPLMPSFLGLIMSWLEPKKHLKLTLIPCSSYMMPEFGVFRILEWISKLRLLINSELDWQGNGSREVNRKVVEYAASWKMMSRPPGYPFIATRPMSPEIWPAESHSFDLVCSFIEEYVLLGGIANSSVFRHVYLKCAWVSGHFLRLDFVGRIKEGEGGQWTSGWWGESGEEPSVRR